MSEFLMAFLANWWPAPALLIGSILFMMPIRWIVKRDSEYIGWQLLAYAFFLITLLAVVATAVEIYA